MKCGMPSPVRMPRNRSPRVNTSGYINYIKNSANDKWNHKICFFSLGFRSRGSAAKRKKIIYIRRHIGWTKCYLRPTHDVSIRFWLLVEMQTKCSARQEFAHTYLCVLRSVQVAECVCRTINLFLFMRSKYTHNAHGQGISTSARLTEPRHSSMLSVIPWRMNPS